MASHYKGALQIALHLVCHYAGTCMPGKVQIITDNITETTEYHPSVVVMSLS